MKGETEGRIRHTRPSWGGFQSCVCRVDFFHAGLSNRFILGGKRFNFVWVIQLAQATVGGINLLVRSVRRHFKDFVVGLSTSLPGPLVLRSVLLRLLLFPPLPSRLLSVSISFDALIRCSGSLRGSQRCLCRL